MSLDLAPYGRAGTVTTDLARVRWLRGRCLLLRDTTEIREHRRASGIIVPDRELFDANVERKVEFHRGRVLAMGSPARIGDNGPEMPWDFNVGNTVIYVYAVTMQKMRTFGHETGELVVVAQEEIMGVVEP